MLRLASDILQQHILDFVKFSTLEGRKIHDFAVVRPLFCFIFFLVPGCMALADLESWVKFERSLKMKPDKNFGESSAAELPDRPRDCKSPMGPEGGRPEVTKRPQQKAIDRVEEASMESFPASDPPGYTVCRV